MIKFLTVLSKANIVYMSIFVIGELYAGFKGDNRERFNRELLRRFLERRTVHLLNTTLKTAKLFSKIKDELKIAGNPIPINDIWIASHAVETGSVLITFDNHFRNIKGLRLWASIAG